MYHGSNPHAFVLNSGSLASEAANRRSQQRRVQDNDPEPITRTFEIDTGYFHCQEHRTFYPNFDYEVVQIQTTDRNASMPVLSDIFYILNFPIDQLSERLIEEAIRLNPRRIALCNPKSSEVFRRNYYRIVDTTLNILGHISLTKITLCVDILNDALFRTLGNQPHLREIEILRPNPTSPEGSTHIQQVLNRGFALAALLPQVKFFNIPLEIVHSFPAIVDNLTSIP